MADNVIGKNIMLYYHEPSSVEYPDGRDIPFSCSTDCSFNVTAEQKEVTSQTSAWYREYKTDVGSWSISCNGLITLSGYGYLFLLNQQQTRTTILVKFVIDNGADGLVIISGNCNLTNLDINAPYKDVATYSVTLQGTGGFGTSGATIDPSGVVITGGATIMKQFTAAGGETTKVWTDLIGSDILYISRGGIDVREILTIGTPVDNQVLWNTTTGTLTFGRVLESDEFIRGLFN